MFFRLKYFRLSCVVVLISVFAGIGHAQGVKRLVLVKIDGLPFESIDKYVHQRDRKTGKSTLPWFDEIFYKNGSRVENFYTRGISLSGPAWGMLDSGQHMQVKGNVEFDRFTQETYDYLRFFAFYFDNFRQLRADMPAAQVMSQMKIPLLVDMFPYEHRYHSPQLYQRDNPWLNMLGAGAVNLIPRNKTDFLNEFSLGFEFMRMTVLQNEREIVDRIVSKPEIDYFDYYDTNFDHVMHDNNDERSRLIELKSLDQTLGKFWTRIQASSRADETAMILLSDHGFNAEEPVFSQGFNLVTMLTDATGGGHHVMTKRRILLDYSLQGVNPFVPATATPSKNSFYLKGRQNDYPTALVDFDGNERSSIHLRDSGLNELQILLQELQRKDLPPAVREASTAEFFKVWDDHRDYWQTSIKQLEEEIGAVQRWIDATEQITKKFPRNFSEADRAVGKDKEARRLEALVRADKMSVEAYRKYIVTLKNLLAISRARFNPSSLKVEELIAPGSMGRNNSIYQMQNYVAGLKTGSIALTPTGEIDREKTFYTVNYFDLLKSQRVRSNQQPKVGNEPIDFVAVRVPLAAIINELPDNLKPNDNPIWLYGGEDRQVLILTRTASDGSLSFRYLPVSDLRQDQDGKFNFKIEEFAAGFPLKIYEDPAVVVPGNDRSGWLNQWHSELEWLHATHKGMYSNAIIGLNEQLDRHPVFDETEGGISDDEKLIRRFRNHQRQLTESDLLILANNHWNFDIRGFNPGGNHGSFFRISTNSTFMLAGGAKTGIPRGLEITEPYDSLSVMPTIMRLMGKIDPNNRPNEELYKMGFRRFPGRVVNEVISGQTRSANASTSNSASAVK
jgi:predicted AlkP superfamily pyrophosphatase or phosphodiesterase